MQRRHRAYSYDPPQAAIILRMRATGATEEEATAAVDKAEEAATALAEELEGGKRTARRRSRTEPE